MRKILRAVLFLLIAIRLTAQEAADTGSLRFTPGEKAKATDTTSLLYAFKKGTLHGDLRYYFMATDNRKGLSDYFAHASGGLLKYETGAFKGFQLGVGGYLFFNLGSTDLLAPDAKTNQVSRYEIGLFDVTNPGKKSGIAGLSELYLRYRWKKSMISFGRQQLNTPFVNIQDGRMRPNTEGGIYAEIAEIKNLKIEGGYLYEISPRSTVRWYSMSESMGLYPVGVNPDGTKSAYKDNIKSKGVLMGGINRKMRETISLKFYDVFMENVFNTALLQIDYRYPLRNKDKLLAAAQFIRQDAINDGGNADPSKTYFTRGAKAHAISAKIGWENNSWQTLFGYTRITADGRYLMPREWGRDPFFTFMPRERNDGFGDVHAYVATVAYKWPRTGLKMKTGWGYFDLPEVNNYRLNKYGMPSYTQLNIDAGYVFSGFLKGMEAQFLFVYKGKAGNTYGNDRYVINKVQHTVWNFIVHYYF